MKEKTKIHAKEVAFIQRKLPKGEIQRIYSLAKTGSFHLRLAIEAFDGLGHGTDTSDLQDFLKEALELSLLLSEASG